MNKEKSDAGIDRIAEEAKETMDLLTAKIDQATRCGDEKTARKRSSKEEMPRTTDTTDRTVDPIRNKQSD